MTGRGQVLTKSDREVAFTLLEVILVITLIGGMMTVVPYSIALRERMELKAAVDRIVKDLKYARVQAIIADKTYIFRIYSRDNLYQINDDGQADYIIYEQNGGREVVLRAGVYPAKFQLFRNLKPVRVKDDYYERIRFTGNGTARGGTIGIKSSSGTLLQIVVSSLGRVRVEKE